MTGPLPYSGQPFFLSGPDPGRAACGLRVVRWPVASACWLYESILLVDCCLSSKRQQHETPDMTIIIGRRRVLRTVALTVGTGAIGLASVAAKPAAAAAKSALTPAGATHLDALMKRLAQAPRRRDFKTVPIILDNPKQWDHEALTEVLSYQPAPKQAWDNTDIA